MPKRRQDSHCCPKIARIAKLWGFLGLVISQTLPRFVIDLAGNHRLKNDTIHRILKNSFEPQPKNTSELPLKEFLPLFYGEPR
jgi:hypothetical protein